MKGLAGLSANLADYTRSEAIQVEDDPKCVRREAQIKMPGHGGKGTMASANITREKVLEWRPG